VSTVLHLRNQGRLGGGEVGWTGWGQARRVTGRAVDCAKTRGKSRRVGGADPQRRNEGSGRLSKAGERMA